MWLPIAACSKFELWSNKYNRMVRGHRLKTNQIIKVVIMIWQWKKSSGSQIGSNL